MSVGKKCLKDVPELFRMQYLDICLFAFVQGILSIRPEFKITAAIELFAEKYKLGDDFNIENELTNYYRSLDKFRTAMKSEKP